MHAHRCCSISNSAHIHTQITSGITKNAVLLQFTDPTIRKRCFAAILTHLECQLFVTVSEVRTYNELGLDSQWE